MSQGTLLGGSRKPRALRSRLSEVILGECPGGSSSKAGHVRNAEEHVGGSSKSRRGSPVAAASVSSLGIALHFHGTPRGRSADLRRCPSTIKENKHGTDHNNDNDDDDDSTNINSSSSSVAICGESRGEGCLCCRSTPPRESALGFRDGATLAQSGRGRCHASRDHNVGAQRDGGIIHPHPLVEHHDLRQREESL